MGWLDIRLALLINQVDGMRVSKKMSYTCILLLMITIMGMSTQPRIIKFSVAPMMGHTNAHFHFLWSLISVESSLYTEMVIADDYIQTPHKKGKIGETARNPVIYQLGGNDPRILSIAAKLLAAEGYKSINLNCGCPSNTVASTHQMGAALMLHPELVAECCSAIKVATRDTLSVSVKCRIGVDNYCDYNFLRNFISTVANRAGVVSFQVHARAALLGQSTIANRDIPSLNHAFVYQLAREFPHLEIEVNGAINTLESGLNHIKACPELTGIMIGRACVNHPYQFIDVDKKFYGIMNKDPLSRGEILNHYIDYCIECESNNSNQWVKYSAQELVAPVFNLFAGEEGGDKYRRNIKSMLQRVNRASLILKAAALAIPRETIESKIFKSFEELQIYSLAEKRSGPMQRMIL